MYQWERWRKMFSENREIAANRQHVHVQQTDAGYMENSVYGLKETRIHYGSLKLKMRFARQFLVGLSHIEFKQNL
jgi:hypothetical protein